MTTTATIPSATQSELRRAASIGARIHRRGEWEEQCSDHHDTDRRCTRACADFTENVLIAPQSPGAASDEFGREEARICRNVQISLGNLRFRHDKFAESLRRLAADLRARPGDEKLRADSRALIEWRAAGGR